MKVNKKPCKLKKTNLAIQSINPETQQIAGGYTIQFSNNFLTWQKSNIFEMSFHGFEWETAISYNFFQGHLGQKSPTYDKTIGNSRLAYE